MASNNKDAFIYLAVKIFLQLSYFTLNMYHLQILTKSNCLQIWSLNNYKCYYTFVEEHARHGIFKNISQGVLQVYVDDHHRLFSCGADGSMKVRQLPDRDFIVSAI